MASIIESQKRRINMVKNKKLQITTIILLVITIVTVSFWRISTYSPSNPIIAKYSVVFKAAANVSPGTIYDRHDQRILFANKKSELQSDLDDSSLYSLSNLIGIDPRNNSDSPFSVRNLASETLYGLKQSGFSKNALLKSSRKGGDIKLTIDSELQKKCYETIHDNPQFFKVPDNAAGSVVVMDYITGEILALVSYPSFHLQNDTTYRLDSFTNRIDLNYKNGAATNRCIQKSYMPASLMKPLVYSAVLTNNFSLKDLEYTCDSHENILHCGIAHGNVNLTDALSYSCNCYTENFINQIYDAEIKGYYKKIGFNATAFPIKQVGYFEGKIDFATEHQNIYSSIGEGSMSASPLMIASSYSSIFNDGMMVEPRLIASESVYHNEEMLPTNPASSKRVCSADAADLVLDGMKAAATTGTANVLSELSSNVAAKTGTTEGNTVAWCVAGLPESRYLVVVCLENTTGSGGKTAAPIAKEILKYMEQSFYG